MIVIKISGQSVKRTRVTAELFTDYIELHSNAISTEISPGSFTHAYLYICSRSHSSSLVNHVGCRTVSVVYPSYHGFRMLLLYTSVQVQLLASWGAHTRRNSVTPFYPPCLRGLYPYPHCLRGYCPIHTAWGVIALSTLPEGLLPYPHCLRGL